jgi:hypothetical protein
MTDEQMLMFVFGKDIAAKSMIFFQQKAQMNHMLASIKESTMAQYAQAAPPPPPPMQSEPQPQPQPTQPEAEYIAVEPEEEVAPKKRAGRPRKI